MRESYEEGRKKLCDAILATHGDSQQDLRRRIDDYAERLGSDVDAPDEHIPSELLAYTTKVARHAYKVTDEDIAGLRAQGYSEDALFEITLSSALGAGMVRLDSGLNALKGALDASEKH
jgi:alkylhydroperoxidase family enzyme